MSTDAPSTRKSTQNSRNNPGWLYRLKFAGQPTASYALDYVPQPNSNDQSQGRIPSYIDVNKVCMTATISTATPDRVGDVLLPRGCDYQDYAKNPVVLWAHGLEQGLTLPIGVSKDPTGQLTLQITDEEVKATCYFAQSNRDAMQIFGLACDGVVVATSVRETPISQRKAYRDGQEISIVSSWALEEWSLCSLGVNPDSIAKARHRKYDGRSLGPSIMKSLNALCPKKPNYGSNFKESDMADKEDEDEGKLDTEAEIAQEALNKPADESNEASRDEDGPAEDTDSHDDMQGDPAEDAKLGRRGMKGAHDDIKSARRNLRSAMKSMDDCAPKDKLQAVHDGLGVLRDQVQADHELHYPKATGLKSEDEGDDGDDEESEDSGSDSEMKSFVAESNVGSKNILLTRTALKSLRNEKGLSALGRKIVDEAINRITLVIDGAEAVKKSRTAQKEDPRIDAALKALKAITASSAS